jgi:hypothetical protein
VHRPIFAADQHMCSSVVLMFTDDDEALAGQWMERISNRNLAGQNPGIMSSPPMQAAGAPPLCTLFCTPPSSMSSTRKPICATRSIESPADTQSIGSMS